MQGGNMKIADFGTLQMARSDAGHFGQSKITPLTGQTPVQRVNGIKKTELTSKTSQVDGVQKKTFQDYLLEAMNSVNSQQLDVTDVQQKLITNPDEVDIHDVTIAMSKARMSLNLAQTVIDRLVTDWNEITTTR